MCCWCCCTFALGIKMVVKRPSQNDADDEDKEDEIDEDEVMFLLTKNHDWSLSHMSKYILKRSTWRNQQTGSDLRGEVRHDLSEKTAAIPKANGLSDFPLKYLPCTNLEHHEHPSFLVSETWQWDIIGHFLFPFQTTLEAKIGSNFSSNTRPSNTWIVVKESSNPTCVLRFRWWLLPYWCWSQLVDVRYPKNFTKPRGKIKKVAWKIQDICTAVMFYGCFWINATRGANEEYAM